MIYKFICKTDQIILISSSSIILLTIQLLPINIWNILTISSFLISWGGWELWWTVGYTLHSLNYHDRAIICNFTEVTNNLYIHSIILAISDVAISLYIFSLGLILFPDGSSNL